MEDAELRRSLDEFPDRVPQKGEYWQTSIDNPAWVTRDGDHLWRGCIVNERGIRSPIGTGVLVERWPDPAGEYSTAYEFSQWLSGGEEVGEIEYFETTEEARRHLEHIRDNLELAKAVEALEKP